MRSGDCGTFWQPSNTMCNSRCRYRHVDDYSGGTTDLITPAAPRVLGGSVCSRRATKRVHDHHIHRNRRQIPFWSLVGEEIGRQRFAKRRPSSKSWQRFGGLERGSHLSGQGPPLPMVPYLGVGYGYLRYHEIGATVVGGLLGKAGPRRRERDGPHSTCENAA